MGACVPQAAVQVAGERADRRLQCRLQAARLEEGATCPNPNPNPSPNLEEGATCPNPDPNPSPNLEEGVVLEHVERVEDVEVEPLGEGERVVKQVSQRGLVGEEVVAVGGAQQRVLVVAEDGRGERVEGDLYIRIHKVQQEGVQGS